MAILVIIDIKKIPNCIGGVDVKLTQLCKKKITIWSLEFEDMVDWTFYTNLDIYIYLYLMYIEVLFYVC